MGLSAGLREFDARVKGSASNVSFSVATPSNCGKSLKLCLPSGVAKARRGQGNDLGYGKNDRDATMGNPQPSPSRREPRDAVQRLNGGGFPAEPDA